MTPAEAIRTCGAQLSSFEVREILDFPEVYFVGRTDKKIQAKVNGTNNYGYDEDSGDYILVPHDQIAYRCVG